jgi:hypothetical protein
MTGSPFVIANPWLGIAALKENALPVMRWHRSREFDPRLEPGARSEHLDVE